MPPIDGLVAVFKDVYPNLAVEWERHFNGDTELLDMVCLLAAAYTSQNYEIHQRSGKSPMSLADREEFWIDSNGPSRFFGATFRCDFSSEQRKRLCEAWNEFQTLLLFGEHAKQLRWELLGHTPDERELVNDEWEKWAARLRRRFAPIFEQADCDR